MFCTKCGAQQADNATFCTKCGAALNGEAEPQPTYVSQPTTPMPQVEYEPEYAEYQPETSAVTEKEQNEALKRELKESKAAYKQARKNAGKSNAPKVVGIVVAVLVVAAIAVVATLFATGALGGSSSASSASDTAAATSTSASADTAASTDSSSSVSTAASSSTSASNSSSSSSASETSNYAAYEGTWTGKMTETSTYFNNKKCYGATNNPATLTISSVSSTGQVKGTLKVIWHGHQYKDLENDVDKHDGDKYVTISDFTTTFSSTGEMTFKGTVDGSKNYIEVSYKYDKSGSTLKVIMEVTSYVDGGNQFTDTYELTKSNS